MSVHLLTCLPVSDNSLSWWILRASVVKRCYNCGRDSPLLIYQKRKGHCERYKALID